MPTGGSILVDVLRANAVERIFCVPGESYLPVLDALYDVPAIQLITARHEAAAANMAEADGKLTGRPGICLVTRGPGATHASIGVHTARQDSTPMILLVGQVPTGVRGREAFQEVDLARMFGGLAKWAAQVDDVRRIDEFVSRAFAEALSGRPGPVVLALPEDVLHATGDAPEAVMTHGTAAFPAPDDLAHLRTLLAHAERRSPPSRDTTAYRSLRRFGVPACSTTAIRSTPACSGSAATRRCTSAYVTPICCSRSARASAT